jgi:hypothetical protein
MTHDVQFHIRQGERQLFLDDADVAQIERLRKTFHPPEKKGAVIRRIPSDSRIGGYPEIRTAPAWDPTAQLWKTWTVCVTPEELQGQAGMSGYHESRDGVYWSAPLTRQVEYNGSYDNNFVFIPMGDGRTGEIFGAVYDSTDPDPARRYKAISYTRKPVQSIIFATSPDGIAWTRLDTPPVPSQDEPNFSFDEQHHQFIATVKVKGPYGRSHALTTSHDFVDWTEPVLVFHADAQDQEEAKTIIARHVADSTRQQPVFVHPEEWATDVYNFAISRYESRYIGFASFFYHTGRAWQDRNHDGFHQVQLAVSHDMQTWARVGNRQPFIAPSPLNAGAYDTLQILGPSRPVLRGDELWFYYSGIKCRWPPENMTPDRSAICLATLRRDGFVSLDADDQGGAVTTQPFTHSGAHLYLNGVARAGSIGCELLDATGAPIPGFEQTNCQPIAGDSTHHLVNWQDQEQLPTGPLRLRIHLRAASLYSYWVE